MTTSVYMPDVKVEVAFNAGWSTPAASRTWTDVSDYLELNETIQINWGRSDELANADANQLSLVLDNSDGRFTALKASSPYYPNVTLGRPIRVTVTYSAVTYTRFLGFIDQWPIEWNGTDRYAKAKVTATSRQAWMGGTNALRSMIQQEILADAPALYYPLGDAVGTTTATPLLDTAGSGGLAVSRLGATNVVFGGDYGPNTDEATAPVFSFQGKFLESLNTIAGVTEITAIYEQVGTGSGTGFNTVFSTYALSQSDPGFIQCQVQNGTQVYLARQDTAGGTSAAASASIPGLDVGPHVISVIGNKVYVDGVLQLTVGGGTYAGPQPAQVLISVGGGNSGTAADKWSVSHLVTGISSLVQIADYTSAALNGFAGELSGARIARIAAYAGIPATELTLDAGIATMAHIDTTGVGPMEVLRRIETTEGGVLFDALGGNLSFLDRADRYTAASIGTLSMLTQDVDNDFAPQYDRTGVTNDVSAQLTGGASPARVVNQTSIDLLGYQQASVDLDTTNVNDPTDRANWEVSLRGLPRVRVPSVSVEVVVQTAANIAALLGSGVGARFAVSNLPSQSAASSGDYFIEGGSEVIGPESYRMTFNTSEATALVNTLVLDSATRGLLDTNTLAY